jgi:DNA topoisomerase-1
LSYLREFYQGEAGLENQVRTKETGIDPRVVSAVELDELDAEVRIGQFGPFVAREQNGERLTAGIPPDLPPADLSAELVSQLLAQKSDGPRSLGHDPASDQPVLLKVGPYGPYVQLGEDEGSKKKPKRASLLKGMNPDELTLDTALRLLSLPRTLGGHPESGLPVQAGVGRFGPYIVHDGRYVSLKAPDDVLEIELDRALDLLAAAPARRGAGSRSSSAKVLHDLGEHPEGGGPIQILNGRYGPYVKHGKVNATIPKEIKPEMVTMDQAVAWLAAKAANGASEPARERKTSTSAKRTGPRKATGKKTNTKAAGKKTASKSRAKKASTTKRAPKNTG